MRYLLLLACLISPLSFAQVDLDKIQDLKAVQFNDGRIVTSGLPREAEFEQLNQAGIELVINLIPSGNSSGHDNEAKLVEKAGMQYQQIEVDWQQPTVANVEQFFDIMAANKDKNILLHCAANYRASAFYYLYLLQQGQTDSAAFKQRTMQPWGELSQSLQEYPQWDVLIDTVKANIAQ